MKFVHVLLLHLGFIAAHSTMHGQCDSIVSID